jgi:hypothetical protein
MQLQQQRQLAQQACRSAPGQQAQELQGLCGSRMLRLTHHLGMWGL